MSFANGDATLSNEFGMRLCEQWGINPNECYAIHIDIEPSGMRAYVHLAINEGTVREILDLQPGARYGHRESA